MCESKISAALLLRTIYLSRMSNFDQFNLSKQLNDALEDLNFKVPTPIQAESFPVILSGKNLVGIAQTGTGKTLAYGLPILHGLKFSKQVTPRILILVPTRELVIQVVDQMNSFAKYVSIRMLGVYGGTNIATQQQLVAQGCDVLVATPGRLYDLVLSRALSLKSIQKLVIDEVDVMLDLGFIFQLTNIFELLPEKRQNIMLSATMTEEVNELINDFFISPVQVSIAVSGTPLENIEQSSYLVENFYTKANLLLHLLKDKTEYKKVLVFVGSKKNADILFELLHGRFGKELGVTHSNKSQNFRIRTIEEFDNGSFRILISTDIMARGLDLEKITHVISVDTPAFPENYMHRIGRTGRADEKGKSILLFTEKEEEAKIAIEDLMGQTIETLDFPEDVKITNQLLDEERASKKGKAVKVKAPDIARPAFHDKKEKNKKVNLGGSYWREIEKKYTKPKTRGDKVANRSKKKKK